MTVYSHSRLNTYENCPLQYKLKYIDRVKVDRPASIEAFVGSRVHETFEKLYKDLLMEKLNSKKELLQYFNDIWEKHWDDDILIVKDGYSEENYRKTGERCISNYYDSHKPFNHSKTLGIEDRIVLDLDGTGNYKLQGYIDRIAQNGSTYEVHDYKTSSHLPLQKHLDEDRQLALYSIGIKE
ncbi:MAG: PD-(D/E)XK nuclease family protein, partial [Candidatus Undinarchaeales archaeon]